MSEALDEKPINWDIFSDVIKKAHKEGKSLDELFPKPESHHTKEQ